MISPRYSKYLVGVCGVKKRRFLAYALLLCGLLFLRPVCAVAASFPAPIDDYINDYAGVLKPADEQSIRALLEGTRAQTGQEIVLVTIESVSDYAGEGATVESFVAALFDHWGIGKKDTNNGVLILFANKDRKVRIELGAGYGSQYDAAMQEVVDGRMLPYFRDGDYSRGLYEGVRGTVEGITRQVSWFKYYAPELALGALCVICILAGISCIRKGKKGWGWAFFSVAGALLLVIIGLLFRRGRKGGKGFGGGRSGGGGASGSW